MVKSSRAKTSVPRFTVSLGQSLEDLGVGQGTVTPNRTALQTRGVGEGCSSVLPGTPGRYQLAAAHLNVKSDEHTPRARAHATCCLLTSLARNNGGKNGVTEPDSGIWVGPARTLS